ncbi:MAG: VTC domain-containing protein [candidate division FCPU426 bacterium]
MKALPNEEGWRFERKFLLNPEIGKLWEARLKLHPAHYHQPFPPRQVNSLYFEGLDFRTTVAQRQGSTRRHKLRLRWYGPAKGLVAAPVLEVKQKRGDLGRKLRFPLSPITMGPGVPSRRLFAILEKAGLPAEILEEARGLPLQSFNTYWRRYYALSGGSIRVTVDSELKVAWPRVGGGPPARWAHVAGMVVELKYPDQLHDIGSQALQGLDLQLVQNSKFLSGIASWLE